MRKLLTLALCGLLILVLVVPAMAQGFRRGGFQPVPVSPGALPRDVSITINIGGQGPLPTQRPGGPWIQPPPGMLAPQGGGVFEPGPGQFPVQAPPGTVALFRLYSPRNSDHLFTTNWDEVVGLMRTGAYRYEGVSCFVLAEAAPGSAPLARGVRMSQMHYLTPNPQGDRRGQIEGVLGHVPVRPAAGWVPLYEWYQPQQDLFLYTLDPRGEQAAQAGFRNNGTIAYVIPPQ